MPYLATLKLHLDRTNPFPYNVPAVQHAKQIDLSEAITFFIGDNGTGKSTLIETIAFRLQLPHLDGAGNGKKSFQAARDLQKYLELAFNIECTRGFFFRAEDFGDLVNSVDRQDARLHSQLRTLEGKVAPEIIQQMKDSANHQIHHVRKHYGQELDSFSHGEAYLKILQEKINSPGIYILDEPEAALSPSKQLALIYFILEHLQTHMSQFIIASHSPILMSMPGAVIYEIDQNEMQQKALEETEHYSITRSFLTNPEVYLRHLGPHPASDPPPAPPKEGS
ncbi:MAG: ATP-binding cassette domain-containing protein [Leeuwenhoekiella sp.]